MPASRQAMSLAQSQTCVTMRRGGIEAVRTWLAPGRPRATRARPADELREHAPRHAACVPDPLSVLEGSLDVVCCTSDGRLYALPGATVVAAIEPERAKACPSEAKLELVERRQQVH